MVEVIEEEVARRNLKILMSKATIVKSLGIFLINVVTIRKIHKKMKQVTLDKKMMMRTPINDDYC